MRILRESMVLNEMIENISFKVLFNINLEMHKNTLQAGLHTRQKIASFGACRENVLVTQRMQFVDSG